MLDEFIECTEDLDELETVTIVCNDCVMQTTLSELRFYAQLLEHDTQQKITTSP